MQIIPVIDLKDGQVVHAIQGNRDRYQPIRSPLCQSAAIEDVVNALLSLHPFRKFYIADLNALTETGHHAELIGDVLKRYPDIVFWVDAGLTPALEPCAGFKNFVPVIGSESLHEADLPVMDDWNGKFILSLDFKGDSPVGVDEIFCTPKVWPDTVIIMTLERVGSNHGPDYRKLSAYRNLFRNKEFVAAGGVRDKEDLLSLKKMGIHSALVASALHSGAITAADIAAFR